MWEGRRPLKKSSVISGRSLRDRPNIRGPPRGGFLQPIDGSEESKITIKEEKKDFDITQSANQGGGLLVIKTFFDFFF